MVVVAVATQRRRRLRRRRGSLHYKVKILGSLPLPLDLDEGNGNGNGNGIGNDNDENLLHKGKNWQRFEINSRWAILFYISNENKYETFRNISRYYQSLYSTLGCYQLYCFRVI